MSSVCNSSFPFHFLHSAVFSFLNVFLLNFPTQSPIMTFPFSLISLFSVSQLIQNASLYLFPIFFYFYFSVPPIFALFHSKSNSSIIFVALIISNLKFLIIIRIFPLLLFVFFNLFSISIMSPISLSLPQSSSVPLISCAYFPSSSSSSVSPLSTPSSC